MKTTLQDGLDALAAGLAGNYPCTGADVRAVWDKVQAGSALLPGFEALAAQEIAMNRRTLDALLAMEEAPTRTSLESQAGNALADLRAYRDAASPTNAQTVAIVKVLCRVCIALVRLRLRQLGGGAEAASAPGK